MKSILPILIFTIFSCFAYSQNISKSDAETIAKNAISERLSSLSIENNFKIADSYTERYDDIDVFHVYNLEPEGFVIIAANKSVEPLLAFSYESRCNASGRHPSVKAILNSYGKEISYAVKNNIPAGENVTSEWNRLSVNCNEFEKRSVKSIDQLIKTKWNQGKYFNTMCPIDSAGDDNHVVVGCVATAIAQLFNYFRYPTQGTGSYAYESENYGHLEVNFFQQNFDYDNLPIKPTEYNDNLARLLYSIGVSVDMEYGPNGSGMTNHKGAYTMSTYFGYSPETKYLFKDSIPDNMNQEETYNDSVWNGILVNHLLRKIPLYYAGWGDYNYVSGHAFILDGFSDSTRYHINWGWGGSYDGFFMINNLVTGGNNFTLAHEVIVNAIPNNYPETYCDDKTINSYEGIIDDGSGPLNDYQPESNCTWKIQAQDSVTGFNIDFLKFDIDPDDYVAIYDGDSEDAEVIDILYGGETPNETYVSTKMSLLIKFVSNASASGEGWQISYTPNRPKYCDNISNITELIDTISDGSDSWNYLNNTNCYWKIEMEEEARFTIKILELDTEYDKDFVKIIKDGTSFAKYSGNEIPEQVSFNANRITIAFTTNSSVRGNGFKLAYKVEETNVKEYNNDNIVVYPNPSNDKINIIGENLSSITITDICGRAIIQQNILNNNSVDIENMEAGNYIVKIIDTENNVYTKKIIVIK